MSNATEMQLSEEYAYEEPPAKFSEDHLHRLFVHLHKIGASDLKIQPGVGMVAKVRGHVKLLTGRPLPPAEVEQILMVLYGTNGPARIKSGNAIDQAYELKPKRLERYRFRINAVGGEYAGQAAIEITVRTIAIEPPTVEEVGLESELLAGMFPRDGIIIIAGATGSGKSTTLAACMRSMLEDKDGNRFIMTFEQPIEYVYDTIVKPSSTIFQTSIGEDGNLPNFAAGIRSAMRRAPDVILNGEMRDPETVEQTLAAAQSGHAVYTTVHAHSVSDTFRRIVNFFPHQVRSSVMNGLMSSIRVIVWQRLIRTPEGKRVAMREFLVFSQAMREELMGIGADNIDRMLLRVNELVRSHGQSVSACARELHRLGKISEHELKLASTEAH